MSDTKSKSIISLLQTLVVLGSAPALHAQAVSIAAVDTGTVYNTVTNAGGIYSVPGLPIGAYTLEAARLTGVNS